MSFRPSSHVLLPMVAAAALTLSACGDVAPPSAPNEHAPDTPLLAKIPTRPNGTGIGVMTSKVDRRGQKVEYHGGPVMLGCTNVYFVWYGSWSGSPTPPILIDLAQNLGGSSYFSAVTRYPNAAGIAPGNCLQYSGSMIDSYSRGTSLANYDVSFIVGVAMINELLPYDPNGIFVVFTSADVAETSGFGTEYCGFHTQTSVNGTAMQVAFVGHPDRAPTKCKPQSVGPNGDAAADAMANVLVNELVDTIVDPGFTAWYDKFALEPADKCAWDFGKTYKTANGARANVTLGNRDYLLQQLWVPASQGFCTVDARAAL